MTTDLLLAAVSALGAFVYAVAAVTGYRATGDRPVTPWDRLAAIAGAWGAWGVLAAVLLATQHSAQGDPPPVSLVLPLWLSGVLGLVATLALALGEADTAVHAVRWAFWPLALPLVLVSRLAAACAARVGAGVWGLAGVLSGADRRATAAERAARIAELEKELGL